MKVLFYTAINCMDGRVQLPVISYLKKRFDAQYVDVVTEPGPVAYLADQADAAMVNSIIQRIDISIKKHNSCGIAIVAHYDCAGNPVPKAKQLEQLDLAARFLTQRYPDTKVIGLWVDDKWSVSEVC